MSVKHLSRRSFAIVHFRDTLVLQIPLQATDHSGNHFPACAIEIPAVHRTSIEALHGVVCHHGEKRRQRRVGAALNEL